jgi:hypothetical protein
VEELSTEEERRQEQETNAGEADKSSILLLPTNRGPAAYKRWDPYFLIF